MPGDYMVPAAHYVIHDYAPGKVGIHQRERDGNTGGEKRPGYTVVGAAVMAIAGNLRNHKDCQLRPRMLSDIALKIVGRLCRGGHARIGKDAAVEGVGEKEVEHTSRKIRAVVIEELKVGGILDRIEIWNQRDRHPVISGNSLVASENGALLTGLATAQLDGSFGANTLKINCIVPGRVQGAKETIRLLHQQRCLRTARQRRKYQNRKRQESKCSCARAARREHRSSVVRIFHCL